MGRLRKFIVLPWRMASISPSVVFSGLSSLPEYTLLYVGRPQDRSKPPGVTCMVLAYEDIRSLLIPLMPKGSIVPIELAVANGHRMPILKEAIENYSGAVRVVTQYRAAGFLSPVGMSTAKFVEAPESHGSGGSTLVSPTAEALSNRIVNNGGGILAINVKLSEKAASEIKKLKKQAERKFRGVPVGDVSSGLDVQILTEKLAQSNFDVRIVAYGPSAREVLVSLKGITSLRTLSVSKFDWEGDWEREEERVAAGGRGKPLRMGSRELALFFPYLDRRKGAGYLTRLEVPAARAGTVVNYKEGVHILDVLTDMGDVEELRIPVSDFLMHFMYYAKTGAGKTTLAINLITQLAQKGYRVFFIDPNEFAGLTLPAALSAAGLDPYEDVVVFDPRFYPARFNALESTRYQNLDVHVDHIREMIIKGLNIVEEPVLRSVSSWNPYREVLQAAISLAYELNHRPTLVDVWESIYDVINAENESVLGIVPAGLRAQINSVRMRYSGEKPEERTEKAKAEMSVILTRLSSLLSKEVMLSSLCARDHSDEGGKSPITYDELFSRAKIVVWALPFFLSPDVRDPLIRFLFGSFWLWMLYKAMGSASAEPIFIVLDELHVLVDTYHQQINEIITMARKYGGGLLGFTQDPDQMEGTTREALYLRKIALSQPNVIIFGQTNVLRGDDIPLSQEERELLPSLPEYHSLVRYARGGIVYGGKNPLPVEQDRSIAPDLNDVSRSKGFLELMQHYREKWGACEEDVHSQLERMRLPLHERSSRKYTRGPLSGDMDLLARGILKALKEGCVYVPTRTLANRIAEYEATLLKFGVLKRPVRVFVDQRKAEAFWEDIVRRVELVREAIQRY